MATNLYYRFTRGDVEKSVLFEDLTRQEREAIYDRCDDGMRLRLVEALCAEIADLKKAVDPEGVR